MALSNAERQRRHRQRVQARLDDAPAAERVAEQDGKDFLVDQYFAAGRDLLERLGSEIAQRALAEFEARGDLAWLDFIDMAQHAGRKAAVEIFERLASEWAASLPPRPPVLPPEPQRPTRRRRQ